MRDQVLIFGCSTADQLRLTATKAANTRLELALVLMDIKSLAKVALAVSWMVAKSLVVETHMETAVLGVYKTCCSSLSRQISSNQYSISDPQTAK